MNGYERYSKLMKEKSKIDKKIEDLQVDTKVFFKRTVNADKLNVLVIFAVDSFIELDKGNPVDVIVAKFKEKAADYIRFDENVFKEYVSFVEQELLKY